MILTFLSSHACAPLFVTPSPGCAQVRHDEHLGECFEAVLDQIAIGGHPGGAEQIAADQSFVTVLRGVSPTGATLSGPQASPPSFPIVCIR